MIFSVCQNESVSYELVKKWATLAKVVKGLGGTIAMRLPANDGSLNHQSIALMITDNDLKEVDGEEKVGDSYCIFTDNINLLRHFHWRKSKTPEEEGQHLLFAQSVQQHTFKSLPARAPNRPHAPSFS